MNYADIKDIDIQDGTGVRVSIYVSGCHFHCKECHNKEAWDFNYGKEFTEKEIEHILKSMDHEYISGLSILGGEPLEIVNQQGLVPLVKAVKEKFPDKNIWLYTGYEFDKDILFDMYKKFDFTRDLIDNIDIIIDGQFVLEKKLTDLKERGSYNQRKIDVRESLKQNKAVCLKFGDEYRYEGQIEEEKEQKINKEPKKILVAEKEEPAEVISMPVYAEIPIENIDQMAEEIIINPVEEKVAASSIDKKVK